MGSALGSMSNMPPTEAPDYVKYFWEDLFDPDDLRLRGWQCEDPKWFAVMLRIADFAQEVCGAHPTK